MGDADTPRATGRTDQIDPLVAMIEGCENLLPRSHEALPVQQAMGAIWVLAGWPGMALAWGICLRSVGVSTRLG